MSRQSLHKCISIGIAVFVWTASHAAEAPRPVLGTTENPPQLQATDVGRAPSVIVDIGTPMLGTPLHDQQPDATINDSAKVQASQGKAEVWVSGARFNTIGWTYDTGWRPDKYGAGAANSCDGTYYSQWVPTGNVTITIDNVVTVTSVLSTTVMGISPYGTCLMSGSASSRNGAPYGPGVITIQGRLLVNGGQVSGSTSNSFTLPACTGPHAGTPLRWARNTAFTDNFYSLSESDIASAISAVGYVDKGSPFKMPPRVENDTAHQNGFQRYFKGAPQLEHFYTGSATEATIVQNAGWQFERLEGYVYKTSKPGSVPFYRYARSYPSGDLEHYYSKTVNDPNAAGWYYDGLAGYVCP